MNWELTLLGAASSMLLMLLLATKWKLPVLPALVGTITAALTAAFPFLWIYPLFQTNRGLAVALLTQVALALTLALSLLLLRFWRDPERVPLDEEGVILSAADGKVLYVREVDAGSTPLVTKHGRHYLLSELTGTKVLASTAHVIGVEMSLLDVHVNRCPITGQVKLLKRIEGRFMSLGRDESPFVNNRVTTIIQNASLTVAVVQVASRLVRRVDNYLSVGETVSPGQRLGVIKLGSLVAVVLPKRDDVTIEVGPGDRVTAGRSVLARYGLNEDRAED